MSPLAAGLGLLLGFAAVSFFNLGWTFGPLALIVCVGIFCGLLGDAAQRARTSRP